MRFIVSFAIALAAHIIAGWSWSIFGGIVYGLVLKEGAGLSGYMSNGLRGAVCVGTSWAILIAYNAFVAPEETLSMLSVMGGILGNLHAAVVVVLTLLLGSLLGLFGALVGVQIKKLV